MARDKSPEEMDFEAVLRTAEGRRFLYRIFQRTNVFGSAFAPDSRLAYMEGRRSVGAELLDAVQTTNPLVFAQMVGDAMKALQAEQIQAALRGEDVID